MPGNDTLRFYYPWPAYGVKMSRQWPHVRENFDNLAPLVRAAYVDLQPPSAHNAGENDLSGWAIGERDFRNKFRIWYDKTVDIFKIQFNSGTEVVPIWNDAMHIRESDLRVIITGPGGLESTVGGFYAGTPVPDIAALHQDFPLSGEWIFNHNFDAKPILWNTFRSNGVAIVPSKVDVSDRNTAYFYFNTPVAGTAIATSEGAGSVGVTFRDGTNVWLNKTELNFNNDQFYLTPDASGLAPVLNIRGSTGGGTVTDHGDLIGLADDDHSQYLLASQATDRATFTADWTDLTDGGTTSLHSHAAGATDHGTLTGLGDDDHPQYLLRTETSPGFYGVYVRESDGNPPTFRNDTLIFDSAYFYLHSDSIGKPTVSLRGTTDTLDHGTLSGLGDDDHTQYSLADGTRPFTGTVGGVTPVANSDLATKGYVDLASGGGFYGIYLRESDGNPPTFRNDTIIFDSEYFYLHSNSVGKPTVSFRGTTGTIDHGALTGLEDDDHPQYLLRAETPPGFYGIITKLSNDTNVTKGDTLIFDSTYFNKSANVISINDSGIDHGTLGGLGDDDHPQYLLRTEMPPGFYGIIIRESDGTPLTFKTDHLIFDSEAFYISSDSNGRPTISSRPYPTPFPATALAQSYGILGEWRFDHNLNTANLVWATYDNRQQAIIPEKVDTSDPNTAYFYFIPAIAGKAVLLGGLGTAGQVGTASGITTVTDGSSNYNNQVTLNFSNRDFYLSHGGQAGSSVVNLTSRYIDYISAYIETASVMNLSVEPYAPYSYTLNKAIIDCREGSCRAGFYLLSLTNRSNNVTWKGHSPGLSVGGLDPITITDSLQTFTPSSPLNIQTGECLVFSVSENSAAKWIRISIETERV